MNHQTTLNQIGRRNLMMIGSKGQYVLAQDALTIHCANSVRVVVTLMPSDSYKVQAFRFNKRTLQLHKLAEVVDVYAESLGECVRSMVG